jgi:hypothetical protein
VRKNKYVLEPILSAIGTIRLKELTSADVDAALSHMAKSYSTAAMVMGHLALKRAIRRTRARRSVTLNAAEFCETPKGQARFTPGQILIAARRPGQHRLARSAGGTGPGRACSSPLAARCRRRYH